MPENVHKSTVTMIRSWWRSHRASALDLLGTLLARGGGAPLAFGSNVLIARILGPSDYGSYLTFLSAGLLAGSVAAYGVRPVLTREVAAWPASVQPFVVKAMSRWAFQLTGIASVIVSLPLGIWLASELGMPPSGWRERIGILVILIASAWIMIPSGLLAGLSQVAKGEALGNLIKNGLLLIGAALMLVTGVGAVDNMLWLQGLSFLGAALVGGVWVLKEVDAQPQDQAVDRFVNPSLINPIDRSEWRRSAGKFFAMSAASMLLGRLDVVIVNAIGGAIEAGLFGAAARLGQVASIVGLVWIAWLQPRMSEQWEDRRTDALRRSLRLGFLGALGMTVIPVSIGWALAPELTMLLGEGFAGAVWPFRWLLFGYLFWAGSVPSYALLTMSGREGHVAKIAWLRVIITVLASIPLISMLGALGGAWAWAGGQIIGSVAFVVVELNTRRSQLLHGT